MVRETVSQALENPAVKFPMAGSGLPDFEKGDCPQMRQPNDHLNDEDVEYKGRCFFKGTDF